MLDVNQLKAKLRALDPEEFVDRLVLARKSAHFSDERLERVRSALSEMFGVHVDLTQLHVVGSAKLGFGLLEKKLQNGHVLPAFRAFGPDSDVDIAVTCPPLFEVIWHELSRHANSQPRLPWRSGDLGSYLVHGWLRPDQFPKWVRLQRCDDWWKTIDALSADSRNGRRRIRGGLYHSTQHLRQYQLRGVRSCRTQLETTP
jgi:hypothetical protein